MSDLPAVPRLVDIYSSSDSEDESSANYSLGIDLELLNGHDEMLCNIDFDASHWYVEILSFFCFRRH